MKFTIQPGETGFFIYDGDRDDLVPSKMRAFSTLVEALDALKNLLCPPVEAVRQSHYYNDGGRIPTSHHLNPSEPAADPVADLARDIFSEFSQIEFLDANQTAEILGTTAPNLYQKRKTGTGPKFTRKGREILYYADSVAEYKETYKTRSNAKTCPAN